MPLYSDSEALDTIIKYLAILIPDIFALGRKWTRKWPVALCNSTKVQFLGNPLTLGINADKSMIFEAEQINKLRFGMYAEPMKRSCYYFYSLNYVWFSLPMWVLCARSEGTKMDKSNEYGFGLGLSFTSVNPVYSGSICLVDFVILSWHVFFFFLNPETEDYLKESESWNTPRTELCLSTGRSLTWVFKSVLNINNRRRRIAYFTTRPSIE